jgi:predicted nucleic acid-binding Zn ribbon protein
MQRARRSSVTMLWQGVLIFVVIVAWVLGLTFLAIALTR